MQGFNWEFTPEVLPNGVTLWFLQVPWVDYVSAQVILEIGHRDNQRGHEGAIHLAEHQLFKSDQYPTSTALIHDVYDRGIELGASTGMDGTFFQMRSITQSLPAAWQYVCRALSGEGFGINLESEKEIVLREFSDRGFNVGWESYKERILGECFGWRLPWMHSAITMLGTGESLEHVSSQELGMYWRAATRKIAHVVIAGNINQTTAVAMVSDLPPYAGSDDSRLCKNDVLVPSNRRFQTSWEANDSPYRGSKAYMKAFASLPASIEAEAMNHVLRIMLSAQIARQLRDELGMVYHWEADIIARFDHAKLQLSASAEDLDVAVDVLWEICSNLTEASFTKALKTASVYYQFFDPSVKNVAGSYGVVDMILAHGRIISRSERRAALAAISWPQVERYWRDNFQDQLISIAVSDS